MPRNKAPVAPAEIDATIEDNDDLERSLTQKERDAIDNSDFAWPEEQKYPIDTQAHLDAAAKLIGRAPEAMQAKIKARAIAIAKRKGLSLPDSWQSEEDTKETRSMPPESLSFYVPIERIEPKDREVIGVATAEVKDAHGTIFRYQGSKDAFTSWRGNIREMHDPKKAVGRALEIRPVDEKKQIIVRARISKGAEDTWQKVLDGTLTGFSVAANKGKWSEDIVDGERVPVLERYNLVELSLVDNPSNPEANISIVRADGIASDVLAQDDESHDEASTLRQDENVERAGARVSAQTRDAMHQTRDHALNAAKSAMETCGCDDCSAMSDAMNPKDQSADMRSIVTEIVRAEIGNALRSQMTPMIQRVNALLARDAARPETMESPELTGRVDDITASLAAIKDIVERIAAQPVEGGPVLHGAAVEKRLASQGNVAQRGPQITPETLEYLHSQGVLNNLDAQVAAASLMIQAQPVRG